MAYNLYALKQRLSLCSIRRFRINIPHEVRQVGVAQVLADGHVLAGVIPVVITWESAVSRPRGVPKASAADRLRAVLGCLTL